MLAQPKEEGAKAVGLGGGGQRLPALQPYALRSTISSNYKPHAIRPR